MHSRWSNPHTIRLHSNLQPRPFAHSIYIYNNTEGMKMAAIDETQPAKDHLIVLVPLFLDRALGHMKKEEVLRVKKETCQTHLAEYGFRV